MASAFNSLDPIRRYISSSVLAGQDVAYLSILATLVTCERIFSKAGQILKRRNSPSTVE